MKPLERLRCDRKARRIHGRGSPECGGNRDRENSQRNGASSEKTKIFCSSVERKRRSDGVGVLGCHSFGMEAELLILPHIPASPDPIAAGPSYKTPGFCMARSSGAAVGSFGSSKAGKAARLATERGKAGICLIIINHHGNNGA